MENHTKKYLIECISSHFAKQRKRMTNLSKNTISGLIEIIKKYNIVVPEINAEEKKEERKRAMEENKLKKEQEAIKSQRERLEYQAKITLREMRIALWNEPQRAERKRRFCEAYIQKYHTLTEEQLEKNILSNAVGRRSANLLAEKLRSDGAKNVTVDKWGDINVGHISILNGFETPEKNYTPEEYEQKMIQLSGDRFACVIDAMYEKKLSYLETRADGSMFIHHIRVKEEVYHGLE